MAKYRRFESGECGRPVHGNVPLTQLIGKLYQVVLVQYSFRKSSYPTLHLLVLILLAATLNGCSSAPKTKEVDLVYPPPPEIPRFYFERAIFSSQDVISSTEKGLSLQELLTGAKAGADTAVGFAKPYAIEAAGGRIYVGDTVNRAVLVFDIANQKFFLIGAEEPGQLRKPLGIAVSQDGRIFVSDATNNRVVVYDKDGQYLSAFGGKDAFSRIAGLAVTPLGDRVYVVDTGGVESEEHKVKVFDGNTGDHLFDIGERGTGPGQFNLPRDVDIGPSGLVYVSDGANFRVQVFTQDGKFLKQWGQVGRTFGSFSRPKGIAVDAEENVYVADASFGNFQIFDKEGNLLLYIGERNNAQGPGRYMLPAGIDVDEDGRVYFVDQYFKKVDIFRPAGLEKGTGKLFEPAEADVKGDGAPKVPAD